MVMFLCGGREQGVVYAEQQHSLHILCRSGQPPKINATFRSQLHLACNAEICNVDTAISGARFMCACVGYWYFADEVHIRCV